MEKHISRREWRKLVKKHQRKRRRQKKAKELEKNEQEVMLAKTKDPNYQYWLQQQTELENFKKLAEERQHNEEEEAWLRRELIFQQNFRLETERRKAKEAEEEALRLEEHKKLEEREAAQRKRREERARLEAEAKAEFESVIENMELYLSNEGMETPNQLKRIIETRPGEKLCEFYDRTNCCRFGLGCTYNHRRPILARILLIHHFFMHPLLEESEHREYTSADSHLEANERDLRADYDKFFDDACSELETYGKIINFRCVRNVLAHLRGNVFVEYENKRSALKAFTALQGRFYAKRRLNVEFSNITRWRGSVCGLSFSRNCSRGLKCGYLHLFRNPGNKYNAILESNKTPAGNLTQNMRTTQNTTPLLSWDDVSPYVSKRNWRWSESPEPTPTLEKESMSEKTPITTRNRSPHIRNWSKERSRSPARRKRSSDFSSSDLEEKKRKSSKYEKNSSKDYRS